jgi:alkylation response protein AidB-like acyl-CoA dehydrogenase
VVEAFVGGGDSVGFRILFFVGLEVGVDVWTRSGFLMTEPDIASSDGSNIQLRMERKGDHYLLNGSKWWSSGAGDDRCKIFIVMGKTDPNNPDRFKQQSMMLVPAGTPGITVHRMLSVYGYDDAPHGHGHVTFENVKVPLDAIILGEGRGNEIMQGRLGPGRIHHCMRAIGAAEVALEWMIHRMWDDRKIPFGKPLREHGVLIDWVARARMEIDASRLVVLNAAIKIDQRDAKFALKEIAEVSDFSKLRCGWILIDVCRPRSWFQTCVLPSSTVPFRSTVQAVSARTPLLLTCGLISELSESLMVRQPTLSLAHW